MISLQSYIFMENQHHVGTKADLSFNLRHFWPMKSFRRRDFREKRIDTSRFLTLYNVHTYLKGIFWKGVRPSKLNQSEVIENQLKLTFENTYAFNYINNFMVLIKLSTL